MVKNGVVVVNSTLFNSRAVYRCISDKYDLVGGKELTCLSTARWSGAGTFPQCIGKQWSRYLS